MAEKITKEKWEVQIFADEVRIEINDETAFTAKIDGLQSLEGAIANADRICQWKNNYDTLADTIQDSIRLIEKWNTGEYDIDIGDVWDVLHKALKQAGIKVKNENGD